MLGDYRGEEQIMNGNPGGDEVNLKRKRRAKRCGFYLFLGMS